MPKIIIGALATIVAAAAVAWIQGWFKRKEPESEKKIFQLDRKPRIVIVDDDASLLETMRLSLNGGYDVKTYRNPLEALAEITAEYKRGNCFDLLILDYIMEPLDGPTVIKIVRLLETGMKCRTPIVLLTAMGKMIDKPPGVKAVWRKPQDVLRLSKQVNEILNA